RAARPDGAYGVGEMLRSAVREIIAVDRGDHDMGESEFRSCFCDAYRFVGIERAGKTGFDIAERAGARASVPHDHEGRVFLFPALADVWTSAFLAHGVQSVFAHNLLGGEVARRDGRLDANPVW